MGKAVQAKLRNRTKNESADIALEKCEDFASRARGLMFRKEPQNLIFEFDSIDYNPIHSFFVAFEFDAVYADENMKVVQIIERISPFNAFIQPVQKNKFLLELKVGLANRLKMSAGDELTVVWEGERDGR
ncbi:MAG: DUF192 domain-containing protein [Candidatus Micrarchaeia archaeon]